MSEGVTILPSRNKYMIGDKECVVETFRDSVLNMKGYSTVYINGKEFHVRSSFLDEIAVLIIPGECDEVSETSK